MSNYGPFSPDVNQSCMELWSVNQPQLEIVLSEMNGWTYVGERCVYQSKGWQVVVDKPVKVSDDDIPDNVLKFVSELHYLTRVVVEPTHAPDEAFDLARDTVGSLALASKGVWIADGMIQMPERPPKPLAKPIQPKRISRLSLSWWFTKTPLFTDAGIRTFVDYLESDMPEALPKRYGTFDPPEFVYTSSQREHFINFLIANWHLGFVVWYPHPPFGSVNATYSDSFKWMAGKFRLNQLEIQCDSSVMDETGMADRLQGFWMGVSRFLRPVYGDVRVLKDAIRGKNGYLYDGQTEDHPLPSCWWNGIPDSFGLAMVLGEEYLPLWTRVSKKGAVIDGMGFVSVERWGTGGTLEPILRRVPWRLSQSKFNWFKTVPSV